MTKKQQKKLLTEIMQADEKDGLYKNITAVDYLVEKLNQCEPLYSGIVSLEHKQYIDGLIEQAKQMEKKQIIKAFNDLNDDISAEQYYNEIFNK